MGHQHVKRMPSGRMPSGRMPSGRMLSGRMRFTPSWPALACAAALAGGPIGGARADGDVDFRVGIPADAAGVAPSPFALDPSELDPIRFTRLPDADVRAPSARPSSAGGPRTEVSFSLSPGRPDFSLKGAYGLGALFGEPALAVASVPPVPLRHGDDVSTSLAGTRFLEGLHDGFRYSAGVRIEHEDADIDGTAYVSSSLLGLSYGRLGRLWYGGIDVELEQFADERHGEERPDVLSLDVTTGRRLGITGLGADAPLWLLSLRGDFDLLDAEADATLEPESAWYLNPSLFWRHPGFTFSAEMEVSVPVDTPEADAAPDDEKPDYRLRAVFEKRFK